MGVDAAPPMIVPSPVAKTLAVVALLAALLYGAGVLSLAAIAIGWFALRSLSALACSSLWRSVAWSAVLLGGLGVASALVGGVL